MSVLSCATCLRKVRITGDSEEVLQEGGVRQPAVHPLHAAWDTLRAAHAEGRLPRGTCICGQPLCDDGADAPPPLVPYVLHLPSGIALSIGQTYEGPEGELTAEQVTAHLASIPRVERERPHVVAVQLAMITPVVMAIFLLWAMAATSLFSFLKAFASTVP